MSFIKRWISITLITLGIFWVVWVLVSGDYREPREVILDEYKLEKN